jgi:hypothetical protein
MKLIYTLLSLQAVALLSLPTVQAQTITEGPEVHIDIVHDQPENDPSDPTKALTLKTAIPQKDYAWKKTVYQLAKSANETLLDLMNPFSIAKYFETPEMTYGEILKDKPSMFKLFKINQHRNVPQLKYGPTLVNANHEYKGISDRKFGYCWGYATFVRFFTQVAFYDAAKARPSLKTTYAAIDQILKGQAAVIEGYANLRELTLVPEIEFYLKLASMELWRARAMQFSSLGVTLKSTNWMKFDEVENFTVQLEKRLARGEFPKLVFASLIPTDPFMGMNTDIHVVPAYKVERLSENRIRIHLWDINFYTETLMREPKYLEIDSNHGITYAPYVEESKPYAKGSDLIGRVIIAPENDAETATMLQSLKRFCKNSKTAAYCKKSD